MSEPSRTPPYSKNLEEQILGAILHDNNALPIAMEYLRQTDFYWEPNRLIYAAMLGLFEKNEPIDVATLVEELTARGSDPTRFRGICGTLSAQTANADHVEAHSKKVRDLGILRDAIAEFNQLSATAYENRDIAEFAVLCEQKVSKVLSREVTETFSMADDLAEQTMRLIDASSGHLITGIPTGFSELDRLMGGLQPGELTVLAARPSLGKTALALNVAEYAARKGYRVAFFSLEMTRPQLGHRLAKSIARVGKPEERNPNYTPEERARLQVAKDEMSFFPICFDDGELNPTLLRAKATRYRGLMRSLDLVIVDYLQLMRSAERRGDDSRQGEVSEFSRSLKRLSTSQGVAVLALSQLNRNLEHRGDKRPRLSDLRESGTIEQDADNVVFIHRESAYDQDSDRAEPGPAELLLAKQRNGPVGKAHLMFFPQFARFENQERRYQDENGGENVRD